MNSSDSKRKRYKPGDRVSLTKENATLVEQWLTQVHNELPDIKLNKSEMVNWLLRQRSNKLTQREVAAIERAYFDPVKALEAAIAEAKKMQGLGEDIDVEALVNKKLLLKKRRPTKRKPPNNLKDAANQESVKAALD